MPQTHSFYFLCHSLINTWDTNTFLHSHPILLLWHTLQASPFKPDWSWLCASPWLQAEAVMVGTTHKWKAAAARHCSGGRQWLLETTVPPSSSPVLPQRTLWSAAWTVLCVSHTSQQSQPIWAGRNSHRSKTNSWRRNSCETSSERWMSPEDENSFTEQKANSCKCFAEHIIHGFISLFRFSLPVWLRTGLKWPWLSVAWKREKHFQPSDKQGNGTISLLK